MSETTPKTYAVGDVHGRLDLLHAAEAAIMADLNGGIGRVIFLGDYVDRGPDSRGVVEYLMEAQREGAVTCLKGNHEAMMLEALETGDGGLWLYNGGAQTLASYGGEVPQEHRVWLANLPVTVTDERRVYVHAGLMPGYSLAEQDEDACLWIRDRFLRSTEPFEKHVVHGHTHTWACKRTDEPELLPHRTNLDTAAYHTGVLSVAVFDDTQDGPLRVLKVAA